MSHTKVVVSSPVGRLAWPPGKSFQNNSHRERDALAEAPSTLSEASTVRRDDTRHVPSTQYNETPWPATCSNTTTSVESDSMRVSRSHSSLLFLSLPSTSCS